MKNILVTGGAGYIGSHTAKELVKQGFDVVVLDNLEAGHKEAVDSKAKLEVVDLADKEKVKEIFKKYQPQAVIDFAAYLAVGESMENPKKYFQNNVANFINLLDVMKEIGTKYLIKSSTAAVYGNPTKDSDIPWKESFTETYQPEKSALLAGKWGDNDVIGEGFFQRFIDFYNQAYKNQSELKLDEPELSKLRIPLSIYGLTKALDEILMKKYDNTSGIKSVSLRYFNVCGADPAGKIGEDKPNPTTLMVLAIYQALGKIPKLKVFGNDYPTTDGSGIRDYIHPSDLAVGHLAALNYLFSAGLSETFNLGTAKGSSVFEVIKAVEDASGKKVEYEIMPRRSGDATISVADPSKANSVLHWQTEYNLTDMAETAWKWHNENPEGFSTAKNDEYSK